MAFGSREFIALVNLTTDGCCVMAKRAVLRTGQRVVLQPETLAGLGAHVQWTKGYLAGLRFENPLYGPVYEHLARGFARLDNDLPGGPADFGTELSPALRSKLLAQIHQTEAKSQVSEPSNPRLRVRVDTRRPAVTRCERISEKVLRLYLG
jgi:hypothetical protein